MSSCSASRSSLMWSRENPRRRAGLELLGRIVRMRAHRRDSSLAFPRRLTVPQHRAVRENRDLDAVTFHDRGLARFLFIATGADDVLSHRAKHVDRVEQRVGPPVHRMIACQRNDVDIRGFPDRRETRMKARMLTARSVRELRLLSAL